MKTRWSDDAARIFALLGNQPIAYHPALGRLFGIETSLVFVQSLWFQSDADQRGAESWSIRDSAFADRIGFTHEQLRRHIRPLLDSVTLDGRALLRARVTGFGRQKTTEYRLDTSLAFNYIRSRVPELAQKASPPKSSNDDYENRQTTRMGALKDRERIKESVGGAAQTELAQTESVHPAILAFWEASGRRFWPAAGLVPAIIREVGEDPARVALFRSIQEARLLRGELLMNLDKAFAYLKAGHIPPAARVDAERSEGRRGRTFRHRQVPDPTPEQRAADEEEARRALAAEEAQLVAHGIDPAVARLEKEIARMKATIASREEQVARLMPGPYRSQYIEAIETSRTQLAGMEAQLARQVITQEETTCQKSP